MVTKGVIFDFDGVFTNNLVHVSEDGVEFVTCSRADGIGLDMLRKLNIPMVVISTEVNPVVSARCKKLKIEAIQGCDDKVESANQWASSQRLQLSDIAFLGNDVNDIPLLRQVGFPCCVADAFADVKDVSVLHLKKKGGLGAVREFCEYIKTSFS